MIDLLLQKASKASVDWQRRIVEDVMEFAGASKVTEEVFEQRIALCEACDNFNPESRKCNMCGCFMDVKASLEKMPISGAKIQCSDKINTKW